MKGQEEWLEPSGFAMVVVARLFMVGASIAIAWAVFIRFSTHETGGSAGWPAGPTTAAIVFSGLTGAFWLCGKLSLFLGRKMRERGWKLP